MSDVRASLSTAAALQSASRPTSNQENDQSRRNFSTANTPTGADGLELLRSARVTEESLRCASREVSQHAAAQGRTDALESVTGSNSLARGAAEIAELIRLIEVKIKAKIKSQEIKSQEQLEKNQ